jgi:hypothetical protein
MTKPLLCREKRHVILVHGRDAARQFAAELVAYLHAGQHKGRHVVSPMLAGASTLERRKARWLGIRLYHLVGPATVAVVTEAGNV